MTTQIETAILAGGCFWGMQDLLRRYPGVLSTRVGYTGGDVPNATYRNHGTHAEGIEIAFDPSQISYRQRYPTGMARVAVVDLVALDPNNPRALAYQAARIADCLSRLPVLSDDDMAEPQQAQAIAIRAAIETADARTLDADTLGDVERRLGLLSEAIARRYFLQGAEPLRAGGLTLA